MKKEHKYGEGDWGAVPLRDGGCAVCLIARTAPRIHGILGYFFGPRYTHVPTISDVSTYKPDDAIMICMCGDLGLFEGVWPIIGRLLPWDRDVWPLPIFGLCAYDSPNAPAWRIQYSEEDFEEISRVPISRDECRLLPADEPLHGAGSVEIQLTALLPRTEAHANPENQRSVREPEIIPKEPSVDHFLYYPTEEPANTVADQLRQRGYRVDVRPSTDEDWGVIATHPRPLTEDDFEDICEMLEELAALTGGQYDGYERDI